MRHRKSGRQLNRNSSHRKAMFKNMTASLVEHEMIRTTLPKSQGTAPRSRAADHPGQGRQCCKSPSGFRSPAQQGSSW